MENIPNQAGHLILSEDGIILSSGGQLENDEKIADTIYKIVKTARKKDLGIQDETDGFYKFSVNYPEHSYVVCLSNRKIHIVKRLEGGMTIAV